MITEKQTLAEKEKVLLGLFVSVKGMIDRTNPEASKPPVRETANEPNSTSSNEDTQSHEKKDVLWVCDKCTFQSRSEMVLKEHIKIDHQGPPRTTIYLCDLCEKTCNSQAAFKEHVQQKHQDQTQKR